jgi:agmatinase
MSLGMKAVCLSIALIPSLALSAIVNAQVPLSRQQPQSFIQNSIFAKQHDDSVHAATEHSSFHIDEYADDIPYSGIAYFAHLNATNCFSHDSDGTFDIGFVGAPFDLGVTYRPGARFGPAGARMGSRRLSPSAAYR